MRLGLRMSDPAGPHDVLSAYVQLGWCAVAGPTAMQVVRVGAELAGLSGRDLNVIEVGDLAVLCGQKSGDAKNSTLQRAIVRLAEFTSCSLGRMHIGADSYEVVSIPRAWPSMRMREERRLTPGAQAILAHAGMRTVGAQA